MMALSRRALFVCLFALFALPASAQQAHPLKIVSSFSILSDLIRNVGGDSVEVASLVGPDADAHVFEPSPADAQLLADADLVIVNGLGFEGWLDRLIQASGYRGMVVVATAGITPRQIGKEPDPHAWQNLANAQRYVQNIRDALVKTRPVDAEFFKRRCMQYLERLARLDAELHDAFAAIPSERRRVITSHDAFGYFGAAYGIEFLAPQGMSTDSEASASAVAQLVDDIRRREVSAVFVENITDPRMVERIAREGGARLGGKLFSDALSRPGTQADTYLKLFAYNAKAIAAALEDPSNHGPPNEY